MYRVAIDEVDNFISITVLTEVETSLPWIFFILFIGLVIYSLCR